ncbi:hypothetical protein HY479_01625 [Candidatus Uhrbacteria bacterium]|nr:hypothetical protein [Candidatus Uhrbacteria bacterium]
MGMIIDLEDKRQKKTSLEPHSLGFLDRVVLISRAASGLLEDETLYRLDRARERAEAAYLGLRQRVAKLLS